MARLSLLANYSIGQPFQMNILFSSDDNYARHLGVAIISILQRNRDVNKIRFYVINNNISHNNVEKLKLLVGEYGNAEIVFIPFGTNKSIRCISDLFKICFHHTPSASDFSHFPHAAQSR